MLGIYRSRVQLPRIVAVDALCNGPQPSRVANAAMTAESPSVRRYARLIFVPVILALIGGWALLFNLALSERRATLERVQSQLGFTVATLADFNELSPLNRNGSDGDTSASRTAAIWRALLQYPSVSIWVANHGLLTAGQPPQGNRAAMVLAEEHRGEWAVHGAAAQGRARRLAARCVAARHHQRSDQPRLFDRHRRSLPGIARPQRRGA